MNTITCVKCASCGTLHEVNSNGYIIITGTVILFQVPRGNKGDMIARPEQYNELILCRRVECVKHKILKYGAYDSDLV